MNKLKLLFRRGQGSSGASASSTGGSSSASASASTSTSKHNSKKSQSTTSLNTLGCDHPEQKKQPAVGKQLPHHKIAQDLPSKFYPSIDLYTEERGVDVGIGSSEPANDFADSRNANTLPHSKKKVTSGSSSSSTAGNKKGHKQPKSLAPSTPNVNANARANIDDRRTPIHHNRDNTVTSQQQQQQQQQPSSLNIIECPSFSEVAIPANSASSPCTNNNYSLQSSNASAGTANPASMATFAGNDLYNKKMNPSGIAIGSYQFISTDQEQHLLEAKNKMQEFSGQLERLEKEKSALQSRVNELQPFQEEVSRLRMETQRLQSLYEKSQMEVVNLRYENESLRNRLHDVVNSPLSDAEKHQLIQDSQRLHSSAPASIALPSANNVAANAAGVSECDGTSASPACCLTPDWDKHSSSSEISVACLQDKIIQMEETHYSTNEELQATLQELADLQSQLSDAQAENERLSEEKDVLFQSLCRQTEKLNETRSQLAALQEILLLRDAKQQAEAVGGGDGAGAGMSVGTTSERENKLLDMIKSSQEEREAMLRKQEELSGEANDLRQSLEAATQESGRFRERIALLDSTLDAANAERKQRDAELLQAKEDISQRTIEINRLSTLLENARSKIEELEQDLARGEKTDLSELLDGARKEKDALEERAAELQDQCSRQQAEVRRVKEQLSVLQEECKVAKNNAKCAVSHMEYRLDQMQQEKDKLSGDYQQMAESVAELQIQCKCHLEDKTQLQNLLSETQKHLGDVERKLSETQEQLEKETTMRQQEAEEWEQFQSDLLMTVRVANDFKTEALTEREQLLLDNKTQKEKIRLLEQQIEKLTKQQVQQSETQQSVLSTVQQEMASRRTKIGNFNRQDSRLSVKTLIESIENNKQQAKTSDESAAESQLSPSAIVNSSSSIGGGSGGGPSDVPGSPSVGNNNNLGSGGLITTNSENVRLVGGGFSLAHPKEPLREAQAQQQQSKTQSPQQQQTTTNSLNNGSIKSMISGERKDPLNMLAKNGGSKRNALLKWCQNKTVGYRNIDITNFSSSWNDGLAFCAILHSYLPDRIPYDTLTPANKRRNFSLAFAAAESVGIPTTLNINDMCQMERPDWTQVMSYVTAVYKHFETSIGGPGGVQSSTTPSPLGI